MSRAIKPTQKLTLSEEEYAMRDTEGGKLLFTTYEGKKGAFLIQNDKLTAAAFPEKSKIGSIYTAKVKDVVKNINACFVEIGEGEICFLSFGDAEYPLLLNRVFDGRILEGDELLVQVVRDAQKTKQPTVSAHISLSNDYFALVFGPRRVGFSARLSKEQKKLLTALLTDGKILSEDTFARDDRLISLTGPGIPDTGVIVRTRAAELLGQPQETACERMTQSIQSLAEEYERLLCSALHRTCFSCLKESDNLFANVLDTVTAPCEYGEIVTDDGQIYAWLKEYTAEHMLEKKVRLYQDPLLSLVSLYGLEHRMNTALGERVWLKSGGYLIIQPTEALTVIDVNSGKYETKGKRGEEAVFGVNKEAAEEIALQLRLRNLSGIIIVDFINMDSEACRQKLLDHLNFLVKKDRIKTSVVDMTALGLVEITRKKTTKPLREQL
ncbi:MAG: ribonuclease E/G [bacterium]|nr:ribonuclease E/G [bacterium]